VYRQRWAGHTFRITVGRHSFHPHTCDQSITAWFFCTLWFRYGQHMWL